MVIITNRDDDHNSTDDDHKKKDDHLLVFLVLDAGSEAVCGVEQAEAGPGGGPRAGLGRLHSPRVTEFRSH